jgi:hypothetical protein
MSPKGHSSSRNRRQHHHDNRNRDVDNGGTPTMENDVGTTTAATATATSSLLETLSVAEDKARNALRGTLQLHHWWRQHLYRLSWLVILLCFFQLRKPSEECIRNIKVRSFVRSFVHSFVRSFVHSFIRSFTIRFLLFCLFVCLRLYNPSF